MNNKKKKNNGQNVKKTDIQQDKDKKQTAENKTDAVKSNDKAETVKTEEASKSVQLQDKLRKLFDEIKGASPESIRTVGIAAVKIILPIVAAVIVIAAIVSLVKTKNDKQEAEAILMTEVSTEDSSAAAVEPLEENAYPEVNAMAERFYKALADGDMETVKSIKDYIAETDLIHLEKKSEFIADYQNINCYTKKGPQENTYFLYVTYEVSFNDIETTVPGLNTYYVYTAEDGTLKIDGDMDESVNAALKLVTSQDDVVDLFNKIDVDYKEAVASDEALNALMTELPGKIKTAVGEALAKIEADEEESQTETAAAEATTEEAVEEQPQTQLVNEQVKATATVNVRSSDSEEADKIGRVEEGTELTRVESKINGWSKVIYEDKEAFIKSDYLEVVSVNEEIPEEVSDASEETTTSTVAGMVTAETNVNVRNGASQTADTIGTAEGGASYKLLEDQGEWLKIEYKGQIGFVKAEYFK